MYGSISRFTGLRAPVKFTRARLRKLIYIQITVIIIKGNAYARLWEPLKLRVGAIKIKGVGILRANSIPCFTAH